MNKPMFSILIPVYNVEKYLPQCIESIKNQTFSDYEVILLDDGSRDGSAGLCRQWEAEDSRVRLISRENKGLFTTRLDEIQASRGEYLIFVDSDDYVHGDLLVRLKELIDRYRCDLVTYGRSVVDGKGRITADPAGVFPDETVISGEDREIALGKLQNKRNLMVSIWSKCVKRGLLAPEVPALRAYEGLNMGEDKLFTTCLFTRFQKMVYTDYPLYYYRCDGSGMSSLSRVRDFPDTIRSAKACSGILESSDFRNKESVLKKFWNRDAYVRLSLLKAYLKQGVDRDTYRTCYGEMKALLAPHRKQIDLRYRAAFMLFSPADYWLLRNVFK